MLVRKKEFFFVWNWNIQIRSLTTFSCLFGAKSPQTWLSNVYLIFFAIKITRWISFSKVGQRSDKTKFSTYLINWKTKHWNLNFQFRDGKNDVTRFRRSNNVLSYITLMQIYWIRWWMELTRNVFAYESRKEPNLPEIPEEKYDHLVTFSGFLTFVNECV